ncbi:hypothetical protein PILCRDRAFT_57402, partial [Piloderma croceum F 1598]
TSLRDTSSLTTASCPCLAASNSGVSPAAFSMFTLMLSCARSSCTTIQCPFSAARDSGVCGVMTEEEALEFTSTSSRATSSLTTSSCPFVAASRRGVQNLSSIRSA